jgi:hypothetical protein
MTTPQHKIGSAYGARSTADDVLRGIDLAGKLAIVTGGYSGLGLETTRALAAAGAHVVVPARRRATAQEALAGIDSAEVDELDLADLESVHAFAGRFLGSGRSVDMLINTRRDHGLPGDARRPRLGSAVRDQPPRPLCARQPALAGDHERQRSARRRRLLRRPPLLRHPAAIHGPPVTRDSEVPLVGVRDYAIDPDQAARLWTLSAELTGIDAFATSG